MVLIYLAVQSFRIWIHEVKWTNSEVAAEFDPAVIQDFASLGDLQSCSLPVKFSFAIWCLIEVFLSNKFSFAVFYLKSPKDGGQEERCI